MAEPTNSSEALRKLRNADPSTPQGRETIAQVLAWMEDRTVSPELRRTAERAREQSMEANLREEFPGLDWDGFWRGMKRTTGALASAGRSLLDVNQRAGSWVLEQIGGIGGHLAEGSDGPFGGPELPSERIMERRTLRATWDFLPESERQQAVERGLAESVDTPPTDLLGRTESDEPAAQTTGVDPADRGVLERGPISGQGRPEAPGAGVSGPGAEGAASGAERQQRIDELIASGVPPELAEEMVGDSLAAEDPFIGVPQDFTATLPQDELGAAARQGRPMEREPFYRQTDVRKPLSWPAERIAALQERLADAGLIQGDYRRGWYDSTTQSAYEQLLGFANQRSMGELQALDRMAADRQAQIESRAETTFQPDLPLPPDTNSLRQQARDALVSIGRRRSEIDEAEVAEMVNVMSGQFRRQRQVELERQRRVHEAGVAQQMSPGSPAAQADLSDLEQVDPIASFDEWFQSDDGFGGEIETRETSQEVARRGRTFEQGLNQMRGMVRSGGS